VSTGTRPGTERAADAGLIHRLRERGVLRVATSYAVIAWLLLQIGEVTFEPLGVPGWAMTALIISAAAGFPVALALAWFLEIGPHGVALDTAAAGVARPSAKGLRHYADVIVIGALLITVVVLLMRQPETTEPQRLTEPAIAVMPFQNLSDDPQQEYFSDGLADDLLERLGRIQGLKVIARASSFSFKGKDVDPKTIAAQLGVTSMLEGSVRRDGQRLRLTARLIDGATGQQLWSQSFDRQVTDVFAVQAELADSVVHAIVPTARGSASGSPAIPTSDLDAYDLYLLARTQWVIATQNSIRRSVELAERAVALDPQFAQAHALLGMAKYWLSSVERESDPDRADQLLREAGTAIREALELDPSLSDAHAAYANLLRRSDPAAAEAQFARAIELNPNSALAWHGYSIFLAYYVNRPEEALRATERALELDPRQPITWANYFAQAGWNRFQELFPRVVAMIGDMPFAIDRITMPEATVVGYPVEVMKAGLAKVRMNADDNLPPWTNFFRAWLAVDVGHAESHVTGRGGIHHGVDFTNVRAFLDVEVIGLQQDWPRLDQAMADLAERMGDDHPAVRSTRAFWLMVRGRYEEAEAGGPAAASPWVTGIPPLLNTDADWGQMDAARIWMMRSTGREEQARELVDDLLPGLRAQRTADAGSCRWMGWLRWAAVAASAGLKPEAVEALAGAMDCGILPYAFQPSLPWFRSLEGYARYDGLLRERAHRVEAIGAELLALETANRDLLAGLD
jgi:adenylate cyclase